ncbi:MAG TPA: hypothetical protein DET40_11140 [Lentisphaeria bacterium]|nr:MAG: hypothetical protein A2X45_20050 [Lentisphaerae bacterium GWF2_50_93]HCE44093.1 hypothetical protein [Lentisphaeria bacterium]
MKMFTALIAGLAMLFTAQAYAGVIESLPAETKLVAKVDFQTLKDSEIYRSIHEKHAAKILQGEAFLLQAAGLDINSVKAVWLAGVEQNRGIIIIEGDFNAVNISAAIGANKENEILGRTDCLFSARCPDKKQNGKKNLVMLVDAKTAVVGNPDLAEEFLKNFKSGKSLLAADKLASLSDCFNGGKYLIKASLLGFKPEDVVKNPILANVAAAELCINAVDGLSADAKLLMKGEENVIAVEQILNGFITIIKANPKADEKNKEVRDEFLNNLSIVRNGPELLASTKISNSVIDKVINARGQEQENE